jgi:hypothetical protein
MEKRDDIAEAAKHGPHRQTGELVARIQQHQHCASEPIKSSRS